MIYNLGAQSSIKNVNSDFTEKVNNSCTQSWQINEFLAEQTKTEKSRSS